jgi:methionyl aminopeptidase
MDNTKRLELAKEGGKIHKQINEEIHSWIKPGMKMIDIVNKIENRIKELAQFDIDNPTLKSIGFPTGVSLNECAAHWTPTPGDETILKEDDVCKIDYGINLEGVIIDSAFTISFNPKYDKLLEASRTSTELAIKMAGPDTILGEIGEAVQENMESYEIELNNKTYQIKSIKTLTGHSIEPYKIHGDKSVPNFKINYPLRMKEGEYYAIETFSSTGSGMTKEMGDCSHYMIDYSKDYKNIPINKKDKKFLETIESKFSTLAFCNRWLDSYKIPKYDRHLKSLCSSGIVNKYPPLNDIKGSYTAQFEHSIAITENGKFVFTN